eukprot:805606-Prymnesium_polylepis.1
MARLAKPGVADDDRAQVQQPTCMVLERLAGRAAEACAADGIGGPQERRSQSLAGISRWPLPSRQRSERAPEPAGQASIWQGLRCGAGRTWACGSPGAASNR